MLWYPENTQSILEWLLEEDAQNPSIRYWALKDLLGFSQHAPEVQDAQNKLMQTGPIPVILAAQNSEGWWQKPGSGYSPKYTGTVWQVIFLAELGADPNNPQVQRACQYLLEHSVTPEGIFSASQRQLSFSAYYCLNGNLLYALQKLGFTVQHPRVQRALEKVCEIINSSTWYGGSGPCFTCIVNRSQICAWGIIKMLKALQEVPLSSRSLSMQHAMQLASAILLDKNPAKADYPDDNGISPFWFHIDFPLSYWSDILELVSVLANMGYAQDERLSEAVEWVAGQQDAQGRWKPRTYLRGRMWVNIEKRGKPGKWVTLRALRLMKTLGVFQAG